MRSTFTAPRGFFPVKPAQKPSNGRRTLSDIKDRYMNVTICNMSAPIVGSLLAQKQHCCCTRGHTQERSPFLAPTVGPDLHRILPLRCTAGLIQERSHLHVTSVIPGLPRSTCWPTISDHTQEKNLSCVRPAGKALHPKNT